MLFVFAPFANTPAHAAEGPLFDVTAGKLVIAGTASANTRLGESATVSSSTPAELPFDAAPGSTASARAATPFATTRAFAISPAAVVVVELLGTAPATDCAPAEFCATA
jgi:hypothetical protein